jgi:hypothetical protein
VFTLGIMLVNIRENGVATRATSCPLISRIIRFGVRYRLDSSAGSENPVFFLGPSVQMGKGREENAQNRDHDVRKESEDVYSNQYRKKSTMRS